MTHTYHISGMTCTNCEHRVKGSLLALPDVNAVEVSKENSTATITMDKHIALYELQRALGNKYQIHAVQHSETTEQVKSALTTYKPLLLVFGYILLLTSLLQLSQATFDFMQWMQHFMAGFFISFSFFKMLDLHSFAESYATYDILAKRFKAWGFLYPFVELFLGLAYAINLAPFWINLVTVLVMGLSTIGVFQSVLRGKKIQCACLGTVFQLPMSTVTIVEDTLMVLMAGSALLMLS